MNRIELIRSQLQPLHPTDLVVTDESHLHVGHPGARDGRGHFRVRIVTGQFAGKNRITRHRMIYSALGKMMETDIHALGIEAFTPEEFTTQELK